MHECAVSRVGVSLRELFPEAQFFNGSDVCISSCSSDSRAVRPGDLFVALVGNSADGHDFSRQAVTQGASAILAEYAVPIFDVPVCVVPNSRIAYGRLCQALAGNPSKDIHVIGVTGTKGKTSLTCLIASVLEAAGRQTAILNDLGCCDGVETVAHQGLKMSASSVASWLARSQANGCTHAVMEVSSQALASHQMAGVNLDTVCLSNLRKDHLDYHGTVANYRKAKQRLLDNLSPHGCAIVNADDPGSAGALKGFSGPALTVGCERPAELQGSLLERSLAEQTFLLTAGNETLPVRTRIIGDQHIQNCLMAVAAGLTHGVDLATAIRGVEAVERIPGRMERIECGQKFGVFLDESGNPEVISMCLRELRELTSGRLICVAGIEDRPDCGLGRQVVAAVDRDADMIYLTSVHFNFPACTFQLSTAKSGSGGLVPIRTEQLRGKAIARAIEEANAGDCVLIAGGDGSLAQDFPERPMDREDAQVARCILRSMNSKAAVQGATHHWGHHRMGHLLGAIANMKN